MNNPLLVFGGAAVVGFFVLGMGRKKKSVNRGNIDDPMFNRFISISTPSQYAGFFGAGSSTLEEEVIPMAGFFGAGSSKLEEPPLPGRYDNARPSAGFLSMSSPIQEDWYGPDAYVPWHLRG